jgi:hypothetical protein
LESEKESGETIRDIKKNIGYFFNYHDRLFQNDNSKYGLSGFFDSILVCAITQLKKNVMLSGYHL